MKILPSTLGISDVNNLANLSRAVKPDLSLIRPKRARVYLTSQGINVSTPSFSNSLNKITILITTQIAQKNLDLCVIN